MVHSSNLLITPPILLNISSYFFQNPKTNVSRETLNPPNLLIKPAAAYNIAFPAPKFIRSLLECPITE
jgi:hypothetical protein